MSSRHRQRLAEFLREEISRLIIEQLADPRLSLATVTGVEITDDFAYADVHVSFFLPEGKRRAALQALAHSAGYLRKQIMPLVRSKRVPHFRFVLDETAEKSAHIAGLLKEAARGAPAGAQGADGVAAHGDRAAEEERT